MQMVPRVTHRWHRNISMQRFLGSKATDMCQVFLQCLDKTYMRLFFLPKEAVVLAKWLEAVCLDAASRTPGNEHAMSLGYIKHCCSFWVVNECV